MGVLIFVVFSKNRTLRCCSIARIDCNRISRTWLIKISLCLCFLTDYYYFWKCCLLDQSSLLMLFCYYLFSKSQWNRENILLGCAENQPLPSDEDIINAAKVNRINGFFVDFLKIYYRSKLNISEQMHTILLRNCQMDITP